MKYPQLYKMVRDRAEVSPEEWGMFEKRLELLSFKKGDLLVRPGESALQVFIVLSGVARNFASNSNGREYTKVLRGPYGILASYQEILTGSKAKYSIQAITDIQALQFSYHHFEEMMKTSHMWERLGRKLAEENYLEKERREFALLHLSAEERYQDFLKEFREFKDDIPQYQIANYLGISPEALNRILKRN